MFSCNRSQFFNLPPVKIVEYLYDSDNSIVNKMLSLRSLLFIKIVSLMTVVPLSFQFLLFMFLYVHSLDMYGRIQ